MTDRCIWPGCDRRVRRCHVDHNVEWQHLGATDPNNGAVNCGGHNWFKHQNRYTTRRLSNGDWSIFAGHQSPPGH